MSMTFERERELDRFVQNEVKLNVTALVARMVELGDGEDIPTHAIDYETAAISAGWVYNSHWHDDDTKHPIRRDPEVYEEPTDRLATSWKDAYEKCGPWDIDDEYENAREIFSWYAVSSFLADDLQDLGEEVVRDWYGLDIWGRTTFGQAIGMDSVIQTIFDNLHKGDSNASGN